MTSRAGLQYLVKTSDIGQSYTIDYIRGGDTLKANVTPVPQSEVLARMERRPNKPAEVPKPAKVNETDEFGLAVQPLNAELASKYGYEESAKGVVVSEVKKGSPAEATGIEVGDLITKVIKQKKIVPISLVKEFEELASQFCVAVFVEDKNHKLPGEFKTLAKPSKK